jgi:hypothetical protein
MSATSKILGALLGVLILVSIGTASEIPALTQDITVGSFQLTESDNVYHCKIANQTSSDKIIENSTMKIENVGINTPVSIVYNTNVNVESELESVLSMASTTNVIDNKYAVFTHPGSNSESTIITVVSQHETATIGINAGQYTTEIAQAYLDILGVNDDNTQVESQVHSLLFA